MIGSFATAASVVSIASKASKKRRAPPPPTLSMKNNPNSQENIVNISGTNSEVGKSVPNVPNTLERYKIYCLELILQFSNFGR